MMKLLTLTSLLLFHISAFSQPEKKDFILAFEPYYGNGSDGYTYTAGFNLSASYFLTPRFSVGITIPYYQSGFYRALSFSYRDDITAIMVGPTLRYYFAAASRWKFYSQLDYAYGKQVVEIDAGYTPPATYKSEASSIR